MQPNPYLRTAPRQARSVARLDAIYDATGKVLAEGGIEALSITAVASEVGIPAASIYDYVADARSLLAAYATHRFNESAEALSGVLVPGDSLTESLARVRTILGLYLEQLRSDCGFRLAVAAIQADDQLVDISFQDSLRNAEQLQQMFEPFVEADRAQELADRCLLAVHLSGAAARLLLMLDEADTQRMIETYIDVFTANFTEG